MDKFKARPSTKAAMFLLTPFLCKFTLSVVSQTRWATSSSSTSTDSRTYDEVPNEDLQVSRTLTLRNHALTLM